MLCSVVAVSVGWTTVAAVSDRRRSPPSRCASADRSRWRRWSTTSSCTRRATRCRRAPPTRPSRRPRESSASTWCRTAPTSRTGALLVPYRLPPLPRPSPPDGVVSVPGACRTGCRNIWSRLPNLPTRSDQEFGVELWPAMLMLF